jgi:triosephosphate isomerase
LLTIRPLIAGNWKMNGLEASLSAAREIAAGAPAGGGPRVALCPPATLVHRLAQAVSGSAVEIGGQDCHARASGAFTGDVSAEMLADAGATLVILGHSERRTLHGETDEVVREKVKAALRGGLEPIVCVGETLAERDEGLTLAVIARQIGGSLPEELAGKAFCVAYEPVWAIGTGLTPTASQIAEVHGRIRAELGALGPQAPILYGGSVKAANAREILALPEVGGALVGGASLTAGDFLPIVEAAA